MKHLFAVAVAAGIFTGTPFKTTAQANVNIEKLDAKQGRVAPKFINSIEITPSAKPAEDDVYSEVTNIPPNTIVPVANNEDAAETVVNIASDAAVTAIEKCSPLQFKYALLMDIEVEALTNIALLNFIEDWWATRYRYGGTDRKGIDCSSFTGKLQQEVYNNSMPRTARAQYQVCDKVDKEDLQEGDLVFFNTTGGVSHVGVYLGNNHFVHSSTTNGVTISRLTENYYSKRFISGGRIISSTAQK